MHPRFRSFPLRSALLPLALLGLGAIGCGPEVPPAQPPTVESLGRLQPEIEADLKEATQKLTKDLDDGRLWGQLGLRYEANGLPKQALECYEQAHRLEPKEAKWPYRAGMVSRRDGQLEACIAWMQKSLELDDSYATTYQRIGDAQLQLGQIDAAKANFQKVCGLDAQRPEAWAGLAKVAMQEDQLDAALAAIEKARALDGEAPYWKLLHGNVLIQLGRESEALPLLQAGQGSMPNIIDPWSQGTQGTRTRDQALLERGVAMEEAGDYSGAVRTYRELIAMRPGEARLPLRLARTLLKAGRNDEALKVTDDTLKNFPTQLELLVLRGALLNKAGNSQGAWQCATQALHHHPDRPDGYLFKASLLTGEDRLPEAQAAATKALELAPNDLRARETLGSVLVRQQLIDQAIEVLEPTLYEDGTRPALSYFKLLGTCLEFRGHSERLQKMVEYAREIHGDQVFRRN